MKFIRLLSVLTLLILLGCGSSTNSEAFIQKTTGRYLYNSDETIEVYFLENLLYLKWRGAEAIKPLKVDESMFFVKEMNEKIQFLDNPKDSKYYMVLVPKEDTLSQTFNFRKLDENEKIPSDYLTDKKFKEALNAYLTIQQKDSLDPALKESNFNKLGYIKLREKNYEEALEIFNINMKLYPHSSNVYDSYAEALRKSGDTVQAIEYYKKSIAIDSGNRDAKRFINKYDKK